MNEQTVALATTRAVAWRQQTIRTADGLRLHVRDYGDAASRLLPVACLPGLARTSADFDELACHLAWRRQKERRVIAIDYRGRGRSDYDPNWQNYDIRIEMDDVLNVLTALGIGDVILVGTSRGGLISMAMAAARPAIIRGVVMNDIGPVIDGKGLARIKGYVGKLPTPSSWPEAVSILKRIADQQFTALSDADWDLYARRTWKEENGRLVPDYDVALMKALAQIDLEKPLPVLWPYFEGLAHAPVLSVRGENSDLLSESTQREMQNRHPRCTSLVVPGQGHAPLLSDLTTMAAIAEFIDTIGES
jgi:pimeloyl-ACP methyl ester carboxylesterase